MNNRPYIPLIQEDMAEKEVNVEPMLMAMYDAKLRSEEEEEEEKSPAVEHIPPKREQSIPNMDFPIPKKSRIHSDPRGLYINPVTGERFLVKAKVDALESSHLITAEVKERDAPPLDKSVVNSVQNKRKDNPVHPISCPPIMKKMCIPILGCGKDIKGVQNEMNHNEAKELVCPDFDSCNTKKLSAEPVLKEEPIPNMSSTQPVPKIPSTNRVPNKSSAKPILKKWDTELSAKESSTEFVGKGSLTELIAKKSRTEPTVTKSIPNPVAKASNTKLKSCTELKSSMEPNAEVSRIKQNAEPIFEKSRETSLLGKGKCQHSITLVAPNQEELEETVPSMNDPVPKKTKTHMIVNKIPVEGGGLIPYSIVYTTKHALGFHCKTNTRDCVACCMITSICPYNDNVKDDRLQPGTMVTSVQPAGGAMQTVESHTDLANCYKGAKHDGKSITITFVNTHVIKDAITLASAAAGATKQWSDQGQWRGKPWLGWDGGAPQYQRPVDPGWDDVTPPSQHALPSIASLVIGKYRFSPLVYIREFCLWDDPTKFHQEYTVPIESEPYSKQGACKPKRVTNVGSLARYVDGTFIQDATVPDVGRWLQSLRKKVEECKATVTKKAETRFDELKLIDHILCLHLDVVGLHSKLADFGPSRTQPCIHKRRRALQGKLNDAIERLIYINKTLDKWNCKHQDNLKHIGTNLKLCNWKSLLDAAVLALDPGSLKKLIGLDDRTVDQEVWLTTLALAKDMLRDEPKWDDEMKRRSKLGDMIRWLKEKTKRNCAISMTSVDRQAIEVTDSPKSTKPTLQLNDGFPTVAPRGCHPLTGDY